MRIYITPNATGNPPGKLADAELHFEEGEPLAGLKLIGFGIWEQRTGNKRNVTFPARTYAVNGERRTFALLRPLEWQSGLRADAQETIRLAVLSAYRRHEAGADDATPAPGPLPVQTIAHPSGNLSNARPSWTTIDTSTPQGSDVPARQALTQAPDLDSRITSEAPAPRKEATPPADLF